MSKHLIKILSIVCFIVMVPVIIVAVALCVTETTKYKLNVATICEDNANANVKVLINDKEASSGSFMKNSDVTITFVPTGYELKGVYYGTANSEIVEEDLIADTLTYKFKINKNTNLVGVFNNLVLNVTFTGLMEDGTTEVKNHVAELAEAETYKYGDPLFDLSKHKVNPDSTAAFLGWVMTTGTNNEVYKQAKFNSSADYELKAVWSNQMQVTFFAADGVTPIKTQFYTANDYISNGSKISILTSDDVVASIAKGYKFAGWKNRLGAPIDATNPNIAFVEDTRVEIILTVDLIAYTLDVKKAGFDDTTSSVTYDVVNGFGAYKEKEARKFYDFKGFEFEGLVYEFVAANETDKADYVHTANDEATTKTKLSDKLLSQSLTNITGMEAVWVCELPKIDFVVRAMADDRSFVYGLQDGQTEGQQFGDINGDTHFFKETADEDVFKLENDPVEEFYNHYGNPASIYMVNIVGADTERVDVKLSSVKVFYTSKDNQEFKEADFATLTVAELMNTILNFKPAYDFSTQGIQITLIYEPISK